MNSAVMHPKAFSHPTMCGIAAISAETPSALKKPSQKAMVQMTTTEGESSVLLSVNATKLRPRFARVR